MIRFTLSFALIALFASVGTAQALGCPDFTGNYSTGRPSVWAEETTYEIVQTGCERVKITETVLRVGTVGTPRVSELVVDGIRRIEDIPRIYWANRWQNDWLVREPWTAETDGELAGDRSDMFLTRDPQGRVALKIRYVDEFGNTHSEVTAWKK